MDFLDKPWKYINEGNAHIVLQVLGTDYVVRLIKEDGNTVDLKTIENSVKFVNFVMIPLLSTNEHHLQEIIQIPANKLPNLIKDLYSFRPEKRRTKSVLSPYAIKDINLTILNPKFEVNFCVEIKPKEGFMSAKFRKYSKCYYCLKQFLKVQQNQIESISKYCPLDLFSGDRIRMKNALRHLIKNPQNNFKLFVDGNIAFSDKSNTSDFETIMKNMPEFGSSNVFTNFIVEVLLSNNKYLNSKLEISDDISSEQLELEGDKAHCIEDNHLDQNCFLYKLLQLQKLSEKFSFNIKDSDEKGLEYVEPLLNKLTTENIDLKRVYDREKFISTADPKTLALISAIAKDCSIMISFSTSFEEGLQTIQIGEHKLPYKLSVTDLEPKAAKTLAKRLKTEKQLIEIYEAYLNSTQS